MTAHAHNTAKAHVTKARIPSGRIIIAAISILCLALMLRNSDIAIRQMTYGLQLCVTSVIPSLFPFMVISEWIVSTGAAELLGRILARPCRRLFGIGAESACALLLGLVCGFPIGTRCALSLYRRGAIDRAELSHLLCFSNIPSSAFLISTVGTSLFGDRSLGIRLYAVTVLSALLLGILTSSKKRKRTQIESVSFFTTGAPTQGKTGGGVYAFTEAIGSSALALLQICAFVLFFSVFVGALEQSMSRLSLSPAVSALLFGLFEITGGVSRAASLPPVIGELLCGFFVGWSGISVHCQLMRLCALPELSFRFYWLSKLAHGALNVLLLLLIHGLLRA